MKIMQFLPVRGTVQFFGRVQRFDVRFWNSNPAMFENRNFQRGAIFVGLIFTSFNWVTFPSPFDKYKIRLKKLQ